MIKANLSVSSVLALSKTPEIAVKKGPTSILTHNLVPSTFSLQGTQVKIEPNNLSTALDANIFFKQTFRCVVNGIGSTITGNILDIGTFSSLRSFPLDRCILNTNVQRNGTTGSNFKNSDIICDMERYMNDKELLERNISMQPTKPDILANYNDYFNGSSSQIGSVRNPMSSYGNSEGNLGRGAYGYESNIVIFAGNNSPGAGIAGSVTIDVTLETALMHPLLKAYLVNSKALVGNRSIEINIQYNNNLFPLMWSQSNSPDAGIITGSVVSVTKAPSFSFITYELKNDIAIPQVVYDTYPRVEILDQSVGVVDAGQSKTVYLNSYKLATELDYVSIFVRRSNNTWKSDCTCTNTFGLITNTSVTYDGVASILSNATQTQLWQMCMENGLLLSHLETNGKGYCGAPLRLMFAKNIPMQSGAPGMSTNKNIQINFTFQNTTNENIEYTAYVIYAYKGISETNVDKAVTTLYDNIVSQEDLDSVGSVVKQDTQITSDPHNMWGGKAFVPYDSMVDENKRGLFEGGMAVNKRDIQRRY